MRHLAILGLVGLAGCSSLDFFGFEENAPLHVIERPDGYPSGLFGARLAHVALPADGAAPTMDLLAVSGGRGTPVDYFQLSFGGEIGALDEVWDHYQGLENDAEDAGTGIFIAGLPRFGETGETGCFATGEPNAGRVHLDCLGSDAKHDLVAPPDFLGAHEFGLALAATRTAAGGPSLLAVADQRHVAFFSSFVPMRKGQTITPPPAYGQIQALAAGRLADDRVVLAVALHADTGDIDRLALYLQRAVGSPVWDEAGCLGRPDEPGFGQTLLVRDLDGDGSDELVVSSGPVEGRGEAVHVYALAALVEDPPACDAPVEPLATIRPPTDLTGIQCAAGCGFGWALGAGELATDDDRPELVIGAPRATVDGADQAGAVFIYRFDAWDAPDAVVRDSTAERRARFGGGVLVAPVAGRDELIVGAIGEGELFVAFCTGLGEDINAGGDVPRDASGEIVSTRCRR